MSYSKENEKLEKQGWGIFLIFIGLMIVAPEKYFPEGSFLLGTGIILLGLNYVRHIKKLRINKFTLFIGLVAFLSGLGNILGQDIDILPIILILWGLSLLFDLRKSKNNHRE